MKYVFYIFIIGLVIVVAIGAVSFFYVKSLEPPSVEDAPYALQTFSQEDPIVPSRIYYASEVVIIDGKTILDTYWTIDGDKYKKHNGKKELPENTKVIRR